MYLVKRLGFKIINWSVKTRRVVKLMLPGSMGVVRDRSSDLNQTSCEDASTLQGPLLCVLIVPQDNSAMAVLGAPLYRNLEKALHEFRSIDW